jgi:hypothetical protein
VQDCRNDVIHKPRPSAVIYGVNGHRDAKVAVRDQNGEPIGAVRRRTACHEQAIQREVGHAALR